MRAFFLGYLELFSIFAYKNMQTNFVTENGYDNHR